MLSVRLFQIVIANKCYECLSEKGKIVSTKGERFSQVTKEESQEMKKSIVNIQLII